MKGIEDIHSLTHSPIESNLTLGNQSLYNKISHKITRIASHFLVLGQKKKPSYAPLNTPKSTAFVFDKTA